MWTRFIGKNIHGNICHWLVTKPLSIFNAQKSMSSRILCCGLEGFINILSPTKHGKKGEGGSSPTKATETMTESMGSRPSSSGIFSQDSIRCSSAVNSQIYWADQERHQKLSQEEFYLCRCSTTFPVTRKTMKKNVWQNLKSSLYLQRSLEKDNGHLLVQVPRRNGILSKRTVHKESGAKLQKGCCWNLLREDVQFSVLRIHCPEVNSKAKDMENCRYTLQPTRKRLRLIFRIIVFANQPSLYGAVANMCEEFESLQDRSGQPDMVMGQSIVLSEIKAEVPLEKTSLHTRIFYCNDMKNESKCFHRKTKWVNFVWMQDSYMLLRLDSISWQKTLENNSLRELVVNTLFQEVTNHHNRKDGFRETRELDPYWKWRPVACMVNTELKLESGLWVKTTLNLGSEFLMDQINLWSIQTTTTQKFLKICLKNKHHNWRWRILQQDQRQKQNHKEENVLINRASFRWMKESGLILNQEILLSLRTRFRRK